MADESLSEASIEAPIEDPVLASVVSLRDRLSTSDVRQLILDNFAAPAIKSAKKALWAARQVALRRKKKKLVDRRAAQRAVEEAEFEDLLDFVNCLDESEELPLVSVSAKDLVLLPVEVVKPRSHFEPDEFIAGALSTQCESIEAIQNRINSLECELKSNLKAVQESVNQVAVQLRSGVQNQVSAATPRQYKSNSQGQGEVKRVEPRGLIDRSLNVVVFGVPESRDLLGTESLVSRAFESVVGRRVPIADCRRIGRFSSESSRSRPLLVRLASVWDRRSLLSCKFKLKGFTEVNLFVREDKSPEERRAAARRRDAQNDIVLAHVGEPHGSQELDRSLGAADTVSGSDKQQPDGELH